MAFLTYTNQKEMKMTDTEKEEYIKKHDIRLLQNKHGKYDIVHGRLSLIGKPEVNGKETKITVKAPRRGC